MERNAELSVTANYVLRKIADESILVPVSPKLKNRDCLFVLNVTGYAVYAGLKAGRAIADLRRELLETFEGATEAEVTADVAELVSQLIEIEALRDAAVR